MKIENTNLCLNVLKCIKIMFGKLIPSVADPVHFFPDPDPDPTYDMF